MKIEQIIIETKSVEVDIAALMATYGVSGFSVNAVYGTTEDGIGAEVVVNPDGDDPDDPRFLLFERDGNRCSLFDCGGADLTDGEEAFFTHLAEIAVGMREA